MLVNKVKKDKKCIYISICMIALLSLSGCNKAEQIKETDIQEIKAETSFDDNADRDIQPSLMEEVEIGSIEETIQPIKEESETDKEKVDYMDQLSDYLYQRWDSMPDERKYDSDVLKEAFPENELEDYKNFEMNMVLDTLGLKEWLRAPYSEDEVGLEYDEPLGKFEKEKLKEYTDEDYDISIEYKYGIAVPERGMLSPHRIAVVTVNHFQADEIIDIYGIEKGVADVMTYQERIKIDGSIAEVPEKYIHKMINDENQEYAGYIIYEWFDENKIYYLFLDRHETTERKRYRYLVTLESIDGIYQVTDIKFALDR